MRLSREVITIHNHHDKIIPRHTNEAVTFQHDAVWC